MKAKPQSLREELRPLLAAALESNAGNEALARFLTERSGLPGPRLNLALVGAFADLVGEWSAAPEPSARLISLLESWAPRAGATVPDQSPAIILIATAVLAYGQVGVTWPAQGAAVLGRLREWARDSRWRVREMVATALQRLLTADWERTLTALRGWLTTDDPRVVRAVAAAVAEPPLLKSEARGAQAVAIQAAATAWLAALPAEARKGEAARVLRQALGCTWSVAVAAAPDVGFPALTALAGSGDADLEWIVRENAKKHRLTRRPERLAAMIAALP